MSKFFIFIFLSYILGNPFLALFILLVVLYVLDRRFIGLLPNVFKPFQTRRRQSKLEQAIRLNPHDTSAKHDLARLYMDKKKLQEALELLEQVRRILDDSSDVLAEIGICYLKLHELAKGEQFVLQAIERNPKVMYGEPYLQLGEALARQQPDRAIEYLEKFREIHSSSCLAYYRLGQLNEQLGRQHEAAAAYRETSEIYRTLPKYKRKSERRWHWLALLKSKSTLTK